MSHWPSSSIGTAPVFGCLNTSVSQSSIVGLGLAIQSEPERYNEHRCSTTPHPEKLTMKLSITSFFLVASSICCGATIYECRAYNGSSFLSTGLCSEHKALGVALHSVPDNMPFDQQVKTIEDAKTRKTSVSHQEDSNRGRLNQCAQIDIELKDLQSKYTNWQYVPIDQVNADQGRERDLKTRRSQFQCHSQ